MLFRSLHTKIAIAALAAFVLLVPALPAAARAHPMPSPSASPTPPPEDPAVSRAARREFVAWQAGDLERTRYTAELNGKLTDAKINQVASELGHLGAFVRSEYLGPIVIENAPAGINGYLYRMFCTNGAVYERLVLDGSGKVAGIVFMDKLPSE